MGWVRIGARLEQSSQKKRWVEPRLDEHLTGWHAMAMVSLCMSVGGSNDGSANHNSLNNNIEGERVIDDVVMLNEGAGSHYSAMIEVNHGYNVAVLDTRYQGRRA